MQTKIITKKLSLKSYHHDKVSNPTRIHADYYILHDGIRYQVIAFNSMLPILLHLSS